MLHMDKKQIDSPLAKQVSNLTRVHDFGGCCQKQPDFSPATEGTALILSLQLLSSNGPVSLIIAYAPTLNSPAETKHRFYEETGPLLYSYLQGYFGLDGYVPLNRLWMSALSLFSFTI